MLAWLRIENLALVDRLELELAPGLNVLTGETGAGKSVLVEALALLVGERADAEAVRAGAAGAVVEGLFRLEAPGLRRRAAQLLGEETDELALRREVFRDQRNRCYVGGRLATAAVLRQLGEWLVELHGQHEHQLLLRPSVQLELLDGFGGLEADRLELARGVEAWRAAVRRLEEIRSRERSRGERIRSLREEVADIAAAQIDLAREAELRAEADRLRHVEDRRARGAAVAHALSGAEPGAPDLLRALLAEVRALARDESRFAPAEERLAGALEDLGDLERELLRYLDALSDDPARLAELNAREALLVRLSRRYGTDLPGLLAREASARAELASLEDESSEEAGLARRVEVERRRVEGAAQELSRARAGAARELERAVVTNLRGLGMGKGIFEVRLDPLPALEAGGLERAEFLIAPNPGEPAAPLRAIASGGELSRVTLALKAALAATDQVPTLVFDEIDVGIGGRVAGHVADKLGEIARARQVLVVTHLARIAARADLHLQVEKVVQGGRSLTRAAPLTGEQRVDELSRMLGDEPGSAVSRRHAEEMLAAARGARPRRPAPEPEERPKTEAGDEWGSRRGGGLQRDGRGAA